MLSLYQKMTQRSDAEIISIISECNSLRTAVKQFGFKHGNDPRARTYICKVLKRNNLYDMFNHTCRKDNTTWSKEQLQAAVEQAICMSDVLRTLKLSTVGGNGCTIKRYIKKYNFDISHWNIKKANLRGRNNITLTKEDAIKKNVF